MAIYEPYACALFRSILEGGCVHMKHDPCSVCAQAGFPCPVCGAPMQKGYGVQVSRSDYLFGKPHFLCCSNPECGNTPGGRTASREVEACACTYRRRLEECRKR